MSRARVSARELGPAFDEKARTVDRRQLLRAGAWAAPVLLLATAAPAMAASGDPVEPLVEPSLPTIDTLRITSAGGSAAYGSNWGTTGEIQVHVTFYNHTETALGVANTRTATATVVLYRRGSTGVAPASTTVISATILTPGQQGGSNQLKWVVPGFAKGRNTFYFVVTAPGFVTQTSGDFDIDMP